jgi:hypothetical protein
LRDPSFSFFSAYPNNQLTASWLPYQKRTQAFLSLRGSQLVLLSQFSVTLQQLLTSCLLFHSFGARARAAVMHTCNHEAAESPTTLMATKTLEPALWSGSHVPESISPFPPLGFDTGNCSENSFLLHHSPQSLKRSNRSENVAFSATNAKNRSRIMKFLPKWPHRKPLDHCRWLITISASTVVDVAVGRYELPLPSRKHSWMLQRWARSQR